MVVESQQWREGGENIAEMEKFGVERVAEMDEWGRGECSAEEEMEVRERVAERHSGGESDASLRCCHHCQHWEHCQYIIISPLCLCA